MSKLQGKWPQILIQPLGAMLFLFVILMCLDQLATSQILWAVGAGALASSSYIVFGRPHGETSVPIRIVGGYLVAIATGMIMHNLITALFHVMPDSMTGLTPQMIRYIALIGAISVGVALWMMVGLKLEHPPAAGMTLVLVLDMRDYYVVGVVIAGAFLLALIRMLFRRQLVNLF